MLRKILIVLLILSAFLNITYFFKIPVLDYLGKIAVAVYKENKPINKIDYSFKPSIKQGVYGTLVLCPDSETKNINDYLIWGGNQSTIPMKNLQTNQLFEIEINKNGRFEYYLNEGLYFFNYDFVDPNYNLDRLNENDKQIMIKYNLIKIENNTLIEKDLLVLCPS